MSNHRSAVLVPSLEVDPAEVRWHFIADYHDGPISGLAFFRGRICRFCCFPEDIPGQHVYVLHDLTPEELAEELRDKKAFEDSVGTHWSFDEEGQPLPVVMRSAEAAKRYYEEQSLAGSPRPSDRTVVAWFDTCAVFRATGP